MAIASPAARSSTALGTLGTLLHVAGPGRCAALGTVTGFGPQLRSWPSALSIRCRVGTRFSCGVVRVGLLERPHVYWH